MIVTLPWPDPRLNPNRSKGTHWGSTSHLRTISRKTAQALTVKALFANGLMRAGFTKVPAEIGLTITFVQPDKRARDRDNLLAAMKPALDGVAHALGIDDSCFEPITIKREYGKKPGSVIVEIG